MKNHNSIADIKKATCQRCVFSNSLSISTTQDGSKYSIQIYLEPKFKYCLPGRSVQAAQLRQLLSFDQENQVRKSLKIVLGKKNKPEGEPQMRDPYPWEKQKCSRQHIYSRHHIYSTDTHFFLSILLSMKVGPGASSDVFILSSELLVSKRNRCRVITWASSSQKVLQSNRAFLCWP